MTEPGVVNQAKVEEAYGAWGVSSSKLKSWFTPGQGPSVKLRKHLQVGGEGVSGWYFPGLRPPGGIGRIRGSVEKCSGRHTRRYMVESA